MKKLKYLLLITLILTSSIQLNAEGDQRYRQKKLYKSNGQPGYAIFNINNISTYFKNDGKSDIVPDGNSGFEYPKGTNKHSFFQSGFLYGGKVDGEIRVGGSTYNQGQVPGRIISEGVAEDTELPHVRIYRVRRYYLTADLSGDILIQTNFPYTYPNPKYIESNLQHDIFEQYEKDWIEWPAIYGAPFEDKNLNGTYEPEIDIPGVPGADQTIWFVCNDIDVQVSKSLYGSPPIGIEMQATIWGYKNGEVLSNAMFRKYIIINKSGKTITDMYASMWSDAEIGDATDDFTGCDTTIDLAYVYNGEEFDHKFDYVYGEPVPAAGFKLVQGPIINGSNNDFAQRNGQIIYGKKNLGYTAFAVFVCGDPVFYDPRLGDYEYGTLSMYNFMQGKIGSTGQEFVDPNTGIKTSFCLAGDPIKNEGWIDGQLHPPGCRVFVASAGPYEMAPGDTQEVIYAQIAAVGNNRWESLKLLRYYSSLINTSEDFKYEIEPPAITDTYNGISDNIYFEWDNNSENNKYDNYEFQGYRVYQYLSDDIILKNAGTEIALFDTKDGIKDIFGTVSDTSSGYPIEGIVYNGNDRGIKNYIEIENDYIKNTDFIIGKEYYFGVAAYYYDAANNKTIESKASVFKAVYKNNYNGPKIGDIIELDHTIGIGTLQLFIEIDDPSKITGHKYKFWFSSIEDTVRWNLTDLNTNEILISDRKFSRHYSTFPSPHSYSIPDLLTIDGLKISIENETEPITNFEVVANQLGPLDPPEGAAAEFQGFPGSRPTERQQVGEGEWMFHTGDNGGTFDGGTRGSYEAFKQRSIRGDDKDRLSPYDWEMRFTGQKSYSVRAYQDGAVVEVPFELWCIGINTPDDPSDDYRIIPWMIDNGEDFTFNLESWGQSSTNPSRNYEHSVSGGDNDPFTDWIYWIRPDDTTPGTTGYDKFVSELDLVNMNEGTYDFGGYEIMARTVLVNHNGGSKPPFNQDLPETGTIFRITSGKFVKPGVDEYEFSTKSINEYLNEISLVNKFTVSQNFPNPFNPSTKIKYKIPLENVFGVKNLPVKIIVYDILGREVAKLLDTSQPPGEYEVTFNAAVYSSGVYIYQLTAGDFREVKKMVLLK
ncbi:MAG: T9SS type A sorting domain-containing protein [Bacteroidetes bacterium]|nr:T9SS type A sorting domain-containing protein [Bacteroidota bacterium]